MKSIAYTLVLLAAIPPLLSQEAPSKTDAKILGHVADGTPSPPPPPIRRLVVEAEDILESKTTNLGDQRVTVQRIAPIELPPIPEPTPPPNIDDPETQERLRELGKKYRDTQILFVGATVYHSSTFENAPRTLVRMWDQKTKQYSTFWSSANWNWLGGFGSFEGDDGQQYMLIMSHSNMDIDRWSDFFARHGRKFTPPKVPEIPAGDATFILNEGEPSESSLTALKTLHKIYNTQGDRLQAAYEGREAARKAREEYLRENPEKPKNLIIRQWRIDPKGQAGFTPKPAVTR